MRSFEGRARRLGDDINTDYIITSARKRETLDESVLKRYLLETVDGDFAASVRQGDIIVAGRNFGCGSAMEIAVTVILAAGIPAVVASSFSRAFYRNAINNGLLPIECDTSSIAEGDAIGVVVREESAEVKQLELGRTIIAAPLPAFLLAIVEAGGLVSHIRRFGSLTPGLPA